MLTDAAATSAAAFSSVSAIGVDVATVFAGLRPGHSAHVAIMLVVIIVNLPSSVRTHGNLRCDLIGPAAIDRGRRQFTHAVNYTVCVSAKSFGTRPKVFRITASSNSPRLGPPFREKTPRGR
jgi:hypothetical protein